MIAIGAILNYVVGLVVFSMFSGIYGACIILSMIFYIKTKDTPFLLFMLSFVILLVTHIIGIILSFAFNLLPAVLGLSLDSIMTLTAMDNLITGCINAAAYALIIISLVLLFKNKT